MMAEPEGVRAGLREWVARKATGLGPGELTDATPLFEGRHLKSMHVPDLILLIERLSGRLVDVTALQPGDFHDIDTIVARLVPSAGAEHGPEGAG
jgi:hypothetical protein